MSLSIAVSVWWGNKCLQLPWTKGSGEGEQERLQPYKEGSDWAERNSLRWLWPEIPKAASGAGEWALTSARTGHGWDGVLWCARVSLASKLSTGTQTVQEPQHAHAPHPARAAVLVPRVEPLSHPALRFLPLESTWETPCAIQFVI